MHPDNTIHLKDLYYATLDENGNIDSPIQLIGKVDIETELKIKPNWMAVIFYVAISLLALLKGVTNK